MIQLPRPVLEAIVVGALGFLLIVVLWNRGRSAFVNLGAQDEPFVAALGLAIIALTWRTGFQMAGLVLGIGVFLIAAVARYTAVLDISGVVQFPD